MQESKLRVSRFSEALFPGHTVDKKVHGCAGFLKPIPLYLLQLQGNFMVLPKACLCFSWHLGHTRLDPMFGKLSTTLETHKSPKCSMALKGRLSLLSGLLSIYALKFSLRTQFLSGSEGKVPSRQGPIMPHRVQHSLF